jgi:CheY-like chemotaxis protein
MAGYRVLVIEDNEGDIQLLRLAVMAASLSCELIPISDGEEGFNYVVQTGDDCPDAVLLDLNLPKISGLTILEALRANPSYAKIPVLVLTSSSSSKDRAHVEAFPPVQMVVKPADLDSFLKIGEILKQLLGAS